MEDFSLNMSTNEFSTMAGISAKGKGSQLGWLGWVWTCWQCGQTILKNCNRQGLSCTVLASLISQLHKCWLLLIYFLIVLFIGKWGVGESRKLILVSVDCLITFVPFQKLWLCQKPITQVDNHSFCTVIR